MPRRIQQVPQKCISEEQWKRGMAGSTLYQGVQTLQNLKVDTQHVYHNKDLLKALLPLNSTGVFNKPTNLHRPWHMWTSPEVSC